MNKSDKSIMSFTSRILIVVLLFISCVSRINATHIVGGSVSYKCLGNNQYEIAVTIRRDCFNGDPEAFFDDPASVGVFDANGALVRAIGVSGQLLMSLKLNDTLDEIHEDVCALDGTKSVCIHETTYKGVVTLPFRAGGYIIEYQRCCRNLPLQNIKDPLETGASWIVQISEDALKSCNNSPRFKQWSPIFICAGKPFNFDHSAIDDDGDSLVYKLWTPFVGASRAFPKPQPPNAPDFKEVVWQAPYSEANMLGGDPFKIDPRTGLITAVPADLGQYLLGVKVEEYRNGKLLSTVYRDYEVKIIDCTNLVDAKIVAPALQCDNLSVAFKQQSQNPKFVRWYFDYGRNPNATSTQQEPTYKYADTGTFKVALIITRDSSCFDTAFQTIRLKLSTTTIAQFVTKAGDCVNGVLKISMVNLSTGVEPGSKYNWSVQFNGQTLTSNEKNPSFNLPNGVLATVKLDITQDGAGCSSSVSKTFTTSFVQPEFHKDQQVICAGDTTTIKFILQDSIKGKYTYTWEPSPFIIGGKNTPEPVVTIPTIGSNYIYVTVDNKNGCTSRDSILIISKAKPKLDFRVDNGLGSLLAKFINLSDQLSNYHWDFGVTGTNADTSSLRDPSYTYPVKGTYMITLSTTDGCAPSITKKVTIGGAGISIVDTINACIGKTIALNPKANPIYTYTWSPADKLNNPNIANPTFTVDSARTFIAQLFDAGTGVTVGTQTVIVRTPITDQVNNLPDTIVACSGQPVALNPKGDTNLKYEWTPSNLLDNPTSPNPSATVMSNTVFNVKITNPKDSCTLTDKLIVVLPSKIALDAIPDSLDACNGVPINLNPNGKTNPNLKYKWSPGKVLDDSTKVNPSATVNVSTIFTVTITDIRFANCSVTKSIKVNIPVVNEANKIKDSVKTCAGIPVALNPTGDSRYKFEWTPAAGLDNPNLANPTATVSQSTVYSVKITDTQRGNCVQSRQTKVIVPPAFDVTPAFKDTTSCTVTSFRLKVSSKNPKVTFEWSDPSGTKLGTKDTISVSPVQKTKYVVTGTDENGCKKSDTVSVDPAKINLDAQVLGSTLLCQGDSIRLQAVGSNPGQVLTYQWSPSNAILSGGNTASPTVKPSSTTTFIVNVSNRQGCTAVDSVTVTVSPIGTVTSVANPTTIIIGASSQITTTILPGYTYKWSPVDGLDNPNIANPVAKPKKTTTYTLTATSPDGCTRTLNLTINVTIPECAEPYIFLPNAFSPNGDGKNDVLYLRSNIADRMTLIIYNRWGEKVFETSNQSVGWDGTFRGKILDPDVYAYYLSVTCIDGQTFMKKGNVTILK
jgi:gliding motility-associated-like protein